MSLPPDLQAHFSSKWTGDPVHAGYWDSNGSLMIKGVQQASEETLRYTWFNGRGKEQSGVLLEVQPTWGRTEIPVLRQVLNDFCSGRTPRATKRPLAEHCRDHSFYVMGLGKPVPVPGVRLLYAWDLGLVLRDAAVYGLKILHSLGCSQRMTDQLVAGVEQFADKESEVALLPHLKTELLELWQEVSRGRACRGQVILQHI